MRQPVQELIERYQNNLYAIAFNICKNQADAEDVVQDTLIEAKAYMHHPVEWYRFNTTLLQYDLSTKAWNDLGEYEQLARAGAGAVIQDGRLTIINGELKPGIRTPQVNQAKL